MNGPSDDVGGEAAAGTEVFAVSLLSTGSKVYKYKIRHIEIKT
jgi:hypothetical protein